MKVLHVPFTWWPAPVGGTEIYVQRLCRDLAEESVESVVCVPGDTGDAGVVEGVRVRRFPHATTHAGVEAIYRGDPVAADAFERLLIDEQPDVLHQHAVSPACSAELAVRARKHGVPVVFTYHTPTASCLRGTLLKWGSDICDGVLDANTCAACALDARGVSRGVSSWLGAVPPAFGRGVGTLHLAGGVWTGLRMTALTSDLHDQVRTLWRTADRIVALSPWVERVLATNGVGADRVVKCAHGVPPATVPRRAAPDATEPLRLVHLGRLDATKGTQLLLDALARCPDARLTLDVIGVVQSAGDDARRAAVHAQAQRDARLRLRASVPHNDVIATLAGYDAVVVPSQWMETGPLVVLEAFAAGVPVIGAALGGIADKIRDGRDGILVQPFNSLDAWVSTLQRLAADPGQLRQLRSGIGPVRGSADVAREMAELYSGLASERRASRVLGVS